MQVLMMKRKHKFEIFVLFLTIQIFQHEEIKIKKKTPIVLNVTLSEILNLSIEITGGVYEQHLEKPVVNANVEYVNSTYI